MKFKRTSSVTDVQKQKSPLWGACMVLGVTPAKIVSYTLDEGFETEADTFIAVVMGAEWTKLKLNVNKLAKAKILNVAKIDDPKVSPIYAQITLPEGTLVIAYPSVPTEEGAEEVKSESYVHLYFKG